MYGDHDARLPRKDYNRLYNYDKENNDILDEEDPNYKEYDLYQYELGRKVPFIIWTKDMKGTKLNQEITNVMGMYDVMPTLGNMLGFNNPYALGHDIYDIKDDNIVIFPNGNFVTNKVYYNNASGKYLILNSEENNNTDMIISEDYISNLKAYTERILNVSNDIVVHDLIKKEGANIPVVEESEVQNG